MKNKIERIIFLCKLKNYKQARFEIKELVLLSAVTSSFITTIVWTILLLVNGFYN